MNSLDFINQEIEFLEDMISMDVSLVEDDFDLQEIYKKQQRLRHLKQIKAKLEIMELIGNGWSHMEQTLSGEKIIRFEKLNLDDWLKVWKALEEIGLKKALEVGNNE